jgi:hypothetical protein
MIAAIQNGIWTIKDLTPHLIRKVFQHEDCPGCTMAKVNSLPTLSGSQVKPSSIGDELSLDVCGPYRPTNIRGHRYVTLVIDANTS